MRARTAAWLVSQLSVCVRSVRYGAESPCVWVVVVVPGHVLSLPREITCHVLTCMNVVSRPVLFVRVPPSHDYLKPRMQNFVSGPMRGCGARREWPPCCRQADDSHAIRKYSAPTSMNLVHLEGILSPPVKTL